MKTKQIQIVALSLLLPALLVVGIFLFNPWKESPHVKGTSTVTYEATDDATVWDGSPNSNYGSISTNEAAHSATSDRYFLVKFQNVSLPADATVTSATVKLTKSSCSGTGSLTMYRADQSWVESTVTYNNAPFETGPSAISANDCSDTVWTFNAASAVDSWRTGSPNYGFLIWGPYSGDYFDTFRSSEYGTVSSRPKLEVVYATPDAAPAAPAPAPAPTPEPTPTPQQNTTTPTTTTTPGTNTTAKVETLAPKLSEVLVNDKKVDQRDTAIVVHDGDTLVVKGKAPAGQKVIVTLSGKEFTVTVDPYGDWDLNLDIKDLDNGKYEVFATTIGSDNKNSEKVRLLDFEKKEKEVQNLTKNAKQTLFKPLNIGIALGVLALIGAAIAFIVIRSGKGKKTEAKAQGSDETQAPETVKEEGKK